MIINRNFRKDVPKGINDTFFRRVKIAEEADFAPPVFNVEGFNFAYLKKSDLYIMCVTLENLSPTFLIEMLTELQRLIKDHIGVLSEEAVRKNFVLVYEILDEMFDFGYPQISSTKEVKQFVFTEPVSVVENNLINKIKNITVSGNTMNPNAILKPMSQADDKKGKNEIYVDIYEKLTVVLNSSGGIINTAIDGRIQMKSYLKGNPELTLVLCDEINVNNGYSSAIVLDDYNFHQCVDSSGFNNAKTLQISPPDGEFVVMNYRITSDFLRPFSIFTYIDEKDYKLEVKIKIRSVFSQQNYASNLVVKMPLPRSTTNCYFELAGAKLGQKVDFNQQENCIYWTIKKFIGGTDQTLIAKVSLDSPKTSLARKELGPVSLNFEIPMFVASKLQVKLLKINTNEKNYKANKWVRYVTQVSSYTARIA